MVGLAEVRNHFLSILQTLAVTRCVFVTCGHVGLDTLGGITRRVFETSPFGRTRTERRRHTRVGSFEVEKTSLDVSVGSVHVSEGRVYGLHSSSCFCRTLDFSLGKNVVLCIFAEKREGRKTFQLIFRKILDVNQSRTNGLGHLVFRRRTVRSRRRQWGAQNENHFQEKHNQRKSMSERTLLIHFETCKEKTGEPDTTVEFLSLGQKRFLKKSDVFLSFLYFLTKYFLRGQFHLTTRFTELRAKQKTLSWIFLPRDENISWLWRHGLILIAVVFSVRVDVFVLIWSLVPRAWTKWTEAVTGPGVFKPARESRRRGPAVTLHTVHWCAVWQPGWVGREGSTFLVVVSFLAEGNVATIWWI